jgi:hypothetical protein
MGSKRWDRGDERDEEEHARNSGDLLIRTHLSTPFPSIPVRSILPSEVRSGFAEA